MGTNTGIGEGVVKALLGVSRATALGEDKVNAKGELLAAFHDLADDLFGLFEMLTR